jgi:hypothetical protein
MKVSLYTFSIISVAYIIMFSLTFGFIFPLQQLLFSGVSAQIGLLFLPHGVRVLTLYFYGWRGVLHLLPACYLMFFLSVGQTGHSLYAPIISLVGCYLGMQFDRLTFSDTISVSFKRHDWKLMFWGGVAASIFNALGLAIFDQGLNVTLFSTVLQLDVLGYVIGDVLGLIVCLLSIVYVFRMIKHLKIISDT